MSKTRLEPMGDHVLVVDIKGTNVMEGISLPDNVKQQEMCFGYVVAVGPDCLALKERDRICYGPYAGKNVIMEEVEFRLLREGQIEGKIVDTN